MADSRFFSSAGPISLADLAKIAGAELKPASAGDRLVSDVAPLETAGPDDVSFLDNKRYLPAFAATKAGACLVDPSYAERAPADTALLLTSRPYRGYAMVAQAFYPAVASAPSRHPSAVVDPSAKIGEGCTLQPYAVIGAKVEIGARCRIGSHAVIESGVVIGEDTEIGAHAWLSHCLIGRRCLLHPGVRIGSRGFGFTLDPEGYLDVPQLGRVVVEDEVEIGANSTIDRGAGPDTVIGAGSKIDNLVQIGHNVRLGRGCVLVAQSGIAGSTRLDDHVLVAAQAGVAGHLSLGKGAKVIAAAGVMRDVPPGETVGGAPAMPIKEFWRLVTLWQRQLKARGKVNE